MKRIILILAVLLLVGAGCGEVELATDPCYEAGVITSLCVPKRDNTATTTLPKRFQTLAEANKIKRVDCKKTKPSEPEFFDLWEIREGYLYLEVYLNEDHYDLMGTEEIMIDPTLEKPVITKLPDRFYLNIAGECIEDFEYQLHIPTDDISKYLKANY